MDRRVSVTAATLGGQHPDTAEGGAMDGDLSPYDPPDAGGFEFIEDAAKAETAALDGPSMHSRGDHGPCLYLGDAGERCNRRALEGGFCLRHRQGGIAEGLVTPSRALGATITILVLIWPYVADLVREIIHWMARR
ncbi:MAG TPA: hypothetical protein VN822_05800 [Candidatus Acidoferrales bacterium]|nr:hypothetical protein [Candidatus Acidoferrales bacterium]